MNLTASAAPPGTPERVLDAAERLFAERGFAGTSVRDITDAAGANLGAVNYHFRSKAQLYAEVFARRAALFTAPVLAAARDAGAAREGPARALRAIGRAVLAPYEDREASRRLLHLFAREVVEPRVPRRLFARQFLDPTIDAMTSIVTQARPDLPAASARECAHAFFAQLVHIAKGTDAPALAVDERLDHAVRFTVAAVMNIDAAPPGRARRQTQRKRS